MSAWQWIMGDTIDFCNAWPLDIDIWRTILPGLRIELWYCNFESNSFRISSSELPTRIHWKNVRTLAELSNALS